MDQQETNEAAAAPEKKESTMLDVHSMKIKSGTKIIPETQQRNIEGLPILAVCELGMFKICALDLSKVPENQKELSCIGNNFFRAGNISIEYIPE